MNISSHIEAILFGTGGPVKIKKLEEILGQKTEKVEEGLKELEKKLENRGLCLIRKDGEVMLGTSPQSSKYCEKLLEEELNRGLGKAGLETIAIVLYKGEIDKPEIDYLRGVNSDFTLRNLMIKGLVERKTNPNNKRGYVYSPSLELFQYLGVTKKEELPRFEEFIKKLKEENVE